MSFLRELWVFMRARKKYWLFGALIAQGGLIVALMKLLTL